MSRRIFYVLSILAFDLVLAQNLTYNDLIDATIDIVRTCFLKGKHEKDSVLLGGEYDELAERLLLNAIPLALIAESKRDAFENFTLTRYNYFAYQNYKSMHHLFRLHRFVLVASSQPLLRMTMKKMQDSTWSNSGGFHLLIDRRTETYGCKNAYSYLYAAFEFDLLNAVFFCIHPEEGLVLYTYNPYSVESPNAWRIVEQFEGRNRHPWLLLQRKYVPGNATCQKLKFDKTVDLNGYEVRLNAVNMEPFLKIDYSKTGLDRFSGDHAEIIKIMFASLNASLRITIYNNNPKSLGAISEDGHYVGMLGDLADSKEDMSMNARSLFLTWKLRFTYPHAEAGLCVMTRPTGFVSEIRKLMAFLSVYVVIGIFIICMITYAILSKYEGFILAALNTVRLVTCVSMLRLPKVSSIRIFLCMVFVLFVVINALFQSHWSSLLTVPVPDKNIDTIQDLKKSGYRIYGPKILQYMLSAPALNSQFHIASYQDCKEHVKNSSTAACLSDCLHMYHRIRNENLHPSRKIRELVHTYVTRETWPLFRRVNTLVQRTVEAGLVTMWRRQAVGDLYRERMRIVASRKGGFKVLLLKNLAFSFYILGIGYACAIFVFAVEIIIGRCWKGRPDNARRVRIVVVPSKWKLRVEGESRSNGRPFPWTP